MSEMSYLEKLLDGVEVEWKAVGDIAGYSTTKVDADKLDATSFVGVDNLLADKGGRIDATYQPNTARLTAYEPGDILLGNIRPYLKKVWMAENNGGCSGDVLAIRILADCKKIISPEYLYYALSSDSFFSYSMQHAKGAKMPRGSKDAILNYQIPIPCPSAPEKSLAIQSEIVRILDKFTALTAELTAELTLRKKQYNYYRDKLLSFEEGGVEWKTLDDVFDIVAGGDAPKDALSEFETEEFSIPVLSNGIGNKSLYGWTDRAKIEKPSLTISARGTIGWTSYRSRPFFPIVRLLVLTPKIKLNLKYAYYFMKTIENNYKIPEAGIPQLTKPMLKDIKIPFPCPGNPEESYNEQARIAATLDKFDVLTNSITEGLPREIELRQKQYEYYRDLLFSFPKPETASN
ncbi:restriction endonuclease subunit S [Escherichia coli]|uniref:restriction endonuclease subunit S n=1 Tax=Escherichia coli TaxID=562 RepID=UPI0006A5D4EF|nr:restriction endonuclease subunit S [Escherichia coli]EFH2914533.1 restriction endonuclease subunit S [Escherichia coli]EFK5171408.1 restriction endonuclease subunit S [Escherichia coli]EFO4518181.1 restriction endonuclease subunit S [Escherichia coli]EKP4522764.1 restriction endonuclease subunit S [Escherichia coli]EKQ4393865.1 restriction endonuclease subunit S [Escherichia coli]